MLKRHAVGMVIRNRWDLTFQSLQSLLKSHQPRHEYDLFVIDNGSSPENVNRLKDYIREVSLPIKNAVFMTEATISQAWNLFLSLARNYDYRTKMDNDIVLHGTISVANPAPPSNRSSPADADPKAGAPQGGPPIIGVGQAHAARRRRQETAKARAKERDTSFLTHMQEFASENNVDLVSLVPISPEQNFKQVWSTFVKLSWKDLPYVFGACMMISKKYFDAIGYFDERLHRRIDIDYSQRGIRSKMNIGYHDWYYVYHVGAQQNTETSKAIADQKIHHAIRVESEQGPRTGFVPSRWQNVIEPIEKKAVKNKIINLS